MSGPEQLNILKGLLQANRSMLPFLDYMQSNSTDKWQKRKMGVFLFKTCLSHPSACSIALTTVHTFTNMWKSMELAAPCTAQLPVKVTALPWGLVHFCSTPVVTDFMLTIPLCSHSTCFGPTSSIHFTQFQPYVF